MIEVELQLIHFSLEAYRRSGTGLIFLFRAFYTEKLLADPWQHGVFAKKERNQKQRQYLKEVQGFKDLHGVYVHILT